MMCGDRWLETGSPWEGDEMTLIEKAAGKIEQTANYMRGMCFDLRIPQDTRESISERAIELDDLAEELLEFMGSQNDRA